MESFCDIPRNIPRPTATTERIFTNTHVPDVSLLAQNKKFDYCNSLGGQKSAYQSYNLWKKQAPKTVEQPQHSENKENQFGHSGGSNSPSIMRKQVRFENSKQNDDSLVVFGDQLKKFGSKPTYKNYKSHNDPLTQGQLNLTQSMVKSKPFENIYMANVPNMQLDLSITECPSTKNPTLTRSEKANARNNLGIDVLKNKSSGNVHIPDKFDFVEEKFSTPPIKHYFASRTSTELQRNNFNHPALYDSPKRSLFPSQNASPSSRNVINEQYPLNSTNVIETQNQLQEYKRNDDEPTVRDLLKIIQQQNEQILILQKQVSSLLESRDTGFRQIEPPSENCKKIEKSEKNIPNQHVIQENIRPKSNLQKFAIDVMTSFEVSIRPQNITGNKNLPNDYKNEPKIREITDGEDSLSDVQEIHNDSKNDVSLHLSQTIPIQEKCPSPDHSIHVDMQDYSSDDDENDEEPSDIGWTIYNNVMGQVNNILKRAGNVNQPPANGETGLQYDTLKKVKAATLAHLRTLGVDVSSDQESSVNSDTPGGFNPNEISFAVKQLLLKYLPNEHLAKIAPEPKLQEVWTQKAVKNPKFSFATVQYMRKYNLLGESNNENQREKGLSAQINQNGHKLLDITALKQQPKLL